MTEQQRKGAIRIADIPADILAALNRGSLATATLAEWLAVDQRVLARALLDELQKSIDIPKTHAEKFIQASDNSATQGITRRLRAMGDAVFRLCMIAPTAYHKIADHTSDVVRSWAAMAVSADPEPSFPERLEKLKRFAADQSAATREIAWDAWRTWFRIDVKSNIAHLLSWIKDTDPNIRRCAIEGTRPRGVWTAHIPLLRTEPWHGLPLLEPLQCDESRYVQNAVANWLNDAGKDNPSWTCEICRKWLSDNPQNSHTLYIFRRARRNLLAAK